MALFGSKKTAQNKKTESTTEKKNTPVNSQTVSTRDLSHIIRHPRITEKASVVTESGVYVFNVDRRATKQTIAAAIQSLYNVTPVRVAIAQIPDKKILSRRGYGTKRGGKKAYVYLKKGETIEFA